MEKKGLFCLFLAVLFCFVINLGCMEQPTPDVKGGGTTYNNKFVEGKDLDIDGDEFIDGGIPGGSPTSVIEEFCSAAPSDETEDQCLETKTAALKGTGDCDYISADDPDVCFDDGATCAAVEYSVCAPCINPGATEVPDGVDNDCDKQLLPDECWNDQPCGGDACTEQGDCVDGECIPGEPVDCNDNNPCTDDTCDSVLGCLNASNDLACDDGNFCTESDTCANGVCIGLVIDCDDANECTDDSCEPFSGCHNSNNTADCDDANACTTNDVCAGGACVPGVAKSCDDTNLCTNETCDPLTECVYTQTDCDDGDPCTTDSCDPQTGECVHAPLVCNDFNLCNGTETCDPAIGCVVGVALNCDDENPCTDDSCVPATGCVSVANTAPCTDEDPCTGPEVCSGGACFPGPAVDCDDGDDCTEDSCNSQTGECVHGDPIPDCCMDDADCEGSVPIGFTWMEATGPGPSDWLWNNGLYSFECVSYSGLPNLTCAFYEDSDHDAWVDGPLPSGQESICNDGIDGDLDGDTDCVDDDCDDGSACYGGNPCTTGDVCADGECVFGPAKDCDDLNPCTDDSCEPATGCVFTPNTAACDDGDACTDDDLCEGGACEGMPLNCDDGNVCTDDSCDMVLGCQHVINTATCDDGNPCTTGDVCANSSCTGGPATNCDDGDPCTTDSCDALLGCQNVAVLNCCEVNADCAEGSVCWQGECVEVSGPFPFGIKATKNASYSWWGLAGQIPGLANASGPGTMDEAPDGAYSVTVSVGGAAPDFCACSYAEGVEAPCCILPGGGYGCSHNGDCL